MGDLPASTCSKRGVGLLSDAIRCLHYVQLEDQKLYNAAIRGQLEVARGLVDEGASIEWANDNCNGMRALHAACYHGHDEVVQLLVTSGAEVDALDNWQRTPLHRAAAAGHVAACGLLLASEANTLMRTHNGETALDAARRNNNVKCVALLRGR